MMVMVSACGNSRNRGLPCARRKRGHAKTFHFPNITIVAQVEKAHCEISWREVRSYV